MGNTGARSDHGCARCGRPVWNNVGCISCILEAQQIQHDAMRDAVNKHRQCLADMIMHGLRTGDFSEFER